MPTASATANYKVLGLEAVLDNIRKAKPKLADRAMRKALQAGASRASKIAKARAGSAYSHPTGALKKAIMGTVRKSRKTGEWLAIVTVAKTDKGAVGLRKFPPNVYSTFVEYGTAKKQKGAIARSTNAPALRTHHATKAKPVLTSVFDEQSVLDAIAIAAEKEVGRLFT